MWWRRSLRQLAGPGIFWDAGRVPVRGTINGYPYRSSLSPCGARRMMPVNELLRTVAGAEPGDIVDVVMERDEEERTVEAPPQLKKALAKNKTRASELAEALVYTQERDGSCHCWSEAGRNAGAAARQGRWRF